MIISLDNKQVKLLKKVQKKKHRIAYGSFFLEGEHLIQEAVHTGIVEHVFVDESYTIDGDTIHKNDSDDEVITIDKETAFDYISDEVSKKIGLTSTPQGIYCLAKIVEQKLDDTAKKILIFDGVQDPGNAGAIIRSAVAFNVDTIIFTEDTVDPYNEKLLRATQGAFFHTKIVQLPLVEIKAFLEKLQRTLYVLDFDGTNLAEFQKSEADFILIVGKEGEGIRQEQWQEFPQEVLTIPINDTIESLNVASATSIALYELSK